MESKSWFGWIYLNERTKKKQNKAVANNSATANSTKYN